MAQKPASILLLTHSFTPLILSLSLTLSFSNDYYCCHYRANKNITARETVSGVGRTKGPYLPTTRRRSNA